MANLLAALWDASKTNENASQEEQRQEINPSELKTIPVAFSNLSSDLMLSH